MAIVQRVSWMSIEWMHSSGVCIHSSSYSYTHTTANAGCHSLVCSLFVDTEAATLHDLRLFWASAWAHDALCVALRACVCVCVRLCVIRNVLQVSAIKRVKPLEESHWNEPSRNESNWVEASRVEASRFKLSWDPYQLLFSVNQFINTSSLAFQCALLLLLFYVFIFSFSCYSQFFTNKYSRNIKFHSFQNSW